MTTDISASAPASRDRHAREGDTHATVTVRCDGLIVKYGRTIAVNDVSFEAGAGEVLGLLGPNGAGKTSVIRALTTMIPVAAGVASVAGACLDSPANIRRRIGVLPESTGYREAQTAAEYLRYHARLYGLPARLAHERAMQLLSDFGLEDRCEHRIGTFSRGMRQRLGIARALINRPEVVFLDEPTLGLDPAGQSEILHRIRDIADSDGHTVIVTSHLLDEIERVCDRVLIMNVGRVVASGTVNELSQSLGGPRSLRIRVPAPDAARTLDVLRRTPGIASVRAARWLGHITAELNTEDRCDPNQIALALIGNAIPITAFELEGGSLSDAFLALTS